MNRESAILGTPTYTVFAGELAAVDAELIRQGRLHDLRREGEVRFEKKRVTGRVVDADPDRILGPITTTIAEVSLEPGSRRQPTAPRRPS